MTDRVVRVGVSRTASPSVAVGVQQRGQAAVGVGVVTERGLPGMPGPAGPVGPPGAPGAGFNYVHDQATADIEWMVNHGLGGYPNITTTQLIDIDEWEQIEGDVVYANADTIIVRFGYPVSGRAYLS